MTAWRLDVVERWALRTGLFLLPLAYWWDTFDHYALPKVLFARLFALGLLCLFVAKAVASRRLTIRRTPLDVPWLAFLASAVLSTLFAENQNVAVFGVYSRYDGLLTILTYAALFWLSVQALEGPDAAHALLRVTLASGYAVAWIAILQCVTDSLRLGAIVPAFGTLGQKNVLGAFLAIVCALAYGEVVAARSWGARVLTLNVFVIGAIALFLTFSRTAWLAAGLAGVVGAIGLRGPGLRFGIAGLSVVALPVGAILLLSSNQLQRTDLNELGDRPAVWRDSIHLIASRPLVGYGPDNFGLVFPRFQAADLHQPWDKAHAETLQVAATQGVIGLAAYLLMLFTFIRAFWRGRRNRGAFAAMAAWVAYTFTLQLNFSTPAASFPFWIFAAAAMETWGATRTWSTETVRHSQLVAAAGSAGIVLLLGLGVVAATRQYLADTRLLQAVNADFAGRNGDALAPAQQARALWRRESVYAVEVGNITFERQDWAAASEAYAEAAALGTYNAAVYRNLALADRNLGRFAEARAAARKAVELDRFDPANRALLAQFEGATP